jgi:hypothetical protein
MLNIARILHRGLLVIALTATVLGPTAASAQTISPGIYVGLGNDAAYVVQTDSATLVFGDGALGQTPSAGSAFATSYRYGSGAAGNVDTSPSGFDFESIFCMEFGC